MDTHAHSPTTIVVALAGQPNVGKSTVFNMLTGLNQHVGNWPGKTIEQKEGVFIHNAKEVRLIDLPGTYSLTSNSEEERIARDFIIRERPDIIVAIVNAAALERNLYLVAELLALPGLLIVGLNMIDVAQQRGILVEPHVLEAAMGVTVVPLVASSNRGVAELIEAATRLTDTPNTFLPNRPVIGTEHRAVLEALCSLITGQTPSQYPEDWVALKLLEGDAEITAMMRERAQHIWPDIERILAQHEDAYIDIASARYEWIERMVRAAIVKPKAGAVSLTDHVDHVATHPLWGLAVLVTMLGLVFWLTYVIAMPIVGWLDSAVVGAVVPYLRIVLAPAPIWFSGLLLDGVIAGAGTVMTFLPILVIFFAVLGVLEDTGYMTRAAYVADRYMHWMGLHGRSFLPLFLGFGCNVPAVIGARIVEDKRGRLLTILLAPLVPCAGRMAVIAFLAPAFFGASAVWVTWALVAANLFVLAITGIVLNRVVFRSLQSAFIMEMPIYHLPNVRTIGLYVWNNTVAFVRKAGTIILIASVVVWALSRLPDGDIDHSVLAGLGRWLVPAGQLMGLNDWRLIVVLLSSLVAKENTIAALGILFSTNTASTGLAASVAAALTPAAELAFMVVLMLFMPCVATMAVIRQETGAWKWTVFSSGLLLLISLITGVFVYQAAQLIR